MSFGIINNLLGIKNNIDVEKQESTSYMGRTARWLNNTPGGQLVKGVGNLMLAGGTLTLGAL